MPFKLKETMGDARFAPLTVSQREKASKSFGAKIQGGCTKTDTDPGPPVAFVVVAVGLQMKDWKISSSTSERTGLKDQSSV